MTKRQLNAAVKKFAADLKEGIIKPYSEEAKQQFLTLHNADSSFKSFTAESICIMIVINRTYNLMSFYTFGPAKY